MPNTSLIHLTFSTLHSESCQCLTLITIGMLIDTFDLGGPLCGAGLCSFASSLVAHCCRKAGKCPSTVVDMRDTMQHHLNYDAHICLLEHANHD